MSRFRNLVLLRIGSYSDVLRRASSQFKIQSPVSPVSPASSANSPVGIQPNIILHFYNNCRLFVFVCGSINYLCKSILHAYCHILKQIVNYHFPFSIIYRTLPASSHFLQIPSYFPFSPLAPCFLASHILSQSVSHLFPPPASASLSIQPVFIHRSRYPLIFHSQFRAVHYLPNLSILFFRSFVSHWK